jgi:hypothetical protein
MQSDDVTALKNQTIETAQTLWSAIVERGGLDIPRYDAPLLQELARALGLPSDDFSNALKREQVSIETLLTQFLRVLEPYAGMTNDILALFARASARRSNRNLRMRFEFSKAENDFEFDLLNFREWERRWQHVIQTADVGEFGPLDAFDIRHAFVEEGITYRIHDGQWQNLEPNDELVARWLNDTKRGNETIPATLPPPPQTPDEVLRVLLKRVWGFIEFSRRVTVRVGELAEADAAPFDAEAVSTIVRGAYLLAPKGERLRDTLQPILGRIPTRKIDISVLLEELDEIFSMPVWKKRHELYAIWVGSRIVETMGEGTRVHEVEGSLLFSFRGSQLATRSVIPDGSIHLWSELRTPLSNPEGKGRKASIQPDYVVLREPVTHPTSSLLIVECKQYLRPSKQNFAAALLDYSRGHPNAQILIVNYGPGNESILDTVRLKEPTIRDRTQIIGTFRPGSSDAIRKFETVVAAAIGKLTPTRTVNRQPQREQALGPAEGSVELTWQAAPTDLDLHCWVTCPDGREYHISYENPEYRLDGTRVLLNHDIRQGYGPESIEFSDLGGRSVCVAVNNFSKERALAGCRARAEFRFRKTRILFETPEEGEGDWWLLFECNRGDDTIRLANTISPTQPRGF